MPRCSFDLHFSHSHPCCTSLRVPLGLAMVSRLLGGFGAAGHTVSGREHGRLLLTSISSGRSRSGQCVRPRNTAAADCRPHLLFVVLNIRFYFWKCLLSFPERELNDQVALWRPTPPTEGFDFCPFQLLECLMETDKV